MTDAKPSKDQASRFFEIRIQSVTADQPLPYDIYLMIGGKPVLLRKRGDRMALARIEQLQKDGGESFSVPADQRARYLASLQSITKDTETPTEIRAKFIKESAFVHLHELFTKQDLEAAVEGAQATVEDMVSLVSTDIHAASSLLKLSHHDYYTYNHCVDTSVYAIVLCRRIHGFDKQLLIQAGLAGLLHDIGKRKIDWKLINKTEKLTPREWETLKRHPEYGKEILQDVASVPEEAKRVVHEHHENFDGTGYPQRLAGSQISALARIVTIADVFDALTTTRSYHQAMLPAEALELMTTMQPGKFDPEVFKSFDVPFHKKSPVTLDKEFDPCSPVAPQEFMRKK